MTLNVYLCLAFVKPLLCLVEHTLHPYLANDICTHNFSYVSLFQSVATLRVVPFHVVICFLMHGALLTELVTPPVPCCMALSFLQARSKGRNLTVQKSMTCLNNHIRNHITYEASVRLSTSIQNGTGQLQHHVCFYYET